jgi:hypothetical protein
LAGEIAAACRARGLEAITDADLPPGGNVTDALWEALAESAALVALLPPSGPTTLMSIEIGAARAWNKPIFAITTEPSSVRLPPVLAGTPLYTAGRIDDVIHEITRSRQPLTDEDRNALAKVYAEVGVPVDQFALDPKHLEELVRRFRKATGKAFSGERLLSELLRMRKQGKLPKKRSAG